MSENRVFTLRQPGEFTDALTEVLRSGARQLLAQAVEAEVKDFLAAHADETLDDGRQRLVRHGHLPERTIQTGIGAVEVSQPRVRDRGAQGPEHMRFPKCHSPMRSLRPVRAVADTGLEGVRQRTPAASRRLWRWPSAHAHHVRAPKQPIDRHVKPVRNLC